MLKVNIKDLLSISEKASRKIMEIYHDYDQITFDNKKDDSPLTKADLASHKVIVKELKNLYPEIPIMSEESKLVEFESRMSWSRYFLIDPIDGTKEFIKKNGEFTVNIALIEGNRPHLGVVQAPALDIVYYSDGKESYKLSEGRRTLLPVHCSREHIEIVASRSHLSDETKDYIKRLGGRCKFKSMGSSLKLCLVAEGIADVYPRFAPTCEWDTAAADAIVRTSGGRVVQLNKNDLEYNKQNILNPHFLVFRDPKFLDIQ